MSGEVLASLSAMADASEGVCDYHTGLKFV